jgi:hypothetical protein
VGALNSVFAGTAAAAGAHTRIENAKAAEKARIRQDHARVAQQVFTEAERKRVAQEQAKVQAAVDGVQDRQFALLMDSRADNPEWLLQQGLAGVDNARTDQEESAWQQFTLSQKAAVDRQRDKQETEAAADEMRTYRRGLKVMGAKAASGLDHSALVRDPGTALENTVDYFLDSMMGAAGDDIDDPKKRAALADVATDMGVQSFYREVFPQIEQARQLNQETMGHEMVANVSEGFIDGSVDADEALRNIDGILSRQFANRTPAEIDKMRTDMVAQTVSHLGELRDGLTADVAIEKAEALLGALPAGVMPPAQIEAVRNNFYDKQLPAAAQRETARALAQQEAMVRGQVDQHGNPRSRAETQAIMLSNGDFDRIAETRISELRLDPANPEHALAIAGIREASDAAAEQAMRTQAAAARQTSKRASMHNGTLIPGDASEAWKAGALGTGLATGENVETVRQMWTASGSDIPFDQLGLAPGQPVDYDKLLAEGGEAAVAMVVGAEAKLWGRNAGVDLPAEAGKQLVAMMRDGSEGKRLAAQNFFDQLPPQQSDRLLAGLATKDRAYARAVVFADDLQVTPESLSMQLQRIDEFKASGDAAQIQRFFDGANDTTFKDLRDTTQDAIKAIASPFGGRAEARMALGSDNMTSYYFDRVFETAMAANGGQVPEKDQLEAASLIVYGEFEDQGFGIITVDGGSRFVNDRFKHTNPQIGPIETFDLQLQGELTIDDAQAVMAAVGKSWDSDTPPADTRQFMQAVAIDMAANGNPEIAREFARAEITFRPVSPASPWWDMYANSPTGGIPMIPFANINGTLTPLVTPDQVDVWPFLSSSRRIKADIEAMERESQAQRERMAALSAPVVTGAGEEASRVAGPNYRRFGGTGPRAATAQPRQ